MKFGILLKYPNARRISETAADFAMLCRPFTFFGAFLAGFSLDVLFSNLQYGFFSIPHAFLLGIMMGFFQGGGQAYNQALNEEVMIDRLNGKNYRPTVSGRMSLKRARNISALMFMVTVSLSFLLSPLMGLMSLVMVFFAIAYTRPPFRVKRFFILNNVWQGIARGFLPAIFVSLLYPNHIGLAVAFGSFFAVWVATAQTTKDFGDVVGDKAFGIKTLPVVLGWKPTILTMIFMFAYTFVLMNWLILWAFLPTAFVWLNILALPTSLIIVFLWKGMKFRYGENNMAWIFFYITLASFYMLPALLV